MSLVSPLTVSNARSHLGAVVAHAVATHTPMYLERRGKRVAAIIGADDLDRLIALAEDAADVRDAALARAEMRATAAEPIPWNDVKADLGLV